MSPGPLGAVVFDHGGTVYRGVRLLLARLRSYVTSAKQAVSLRGDGAPETTMRVLPTHNLNITSLVAT